MTKSTGQERKALQRLADALVEDVLETSDDEILAEIVEDFGGAKRLADNMRTLFEQAVLEEGKAKLAAAKKALSEEQAKRGNVVLIDTAEARRRFDAIVSGDPDLSAKLTLAARKGGGLSERDLKGLLEDIADLERLKRGEKDD